MRAWQAAAASPKALDGPLVDAVTAADEIMKLFKVLIRKCSGFLPALAEMLHGCVEYWDRFRT